MAKIMVTTIDNPFDPFTQFDEWYAFDESQGYHTCAYLARIARTSDELSQSDEDLAVEVAVDEIVRLNISGRYRKVTKPDDEDDDKIDYSELMSNPIS